MDERLKKQMEFLLEIDKSKQIGRQTYLADASRKENDAEHAWHLGMMAILLSEYANENINLLKVISMVLVHDLVEIDAGDTYAYDDQGQKTKYEREHTAADRIFGILPQDQELKLRQLWEEFEEWKTPEAKFAHTLDNFQPVLLNDATDGKAWKEHAVRSSQVYERNRRTGEGSEKLYAYLDTMIQKNIEAGNIRSDHELL